MSYVLTRLQRLLKHLASPRGVLILVTALAVAVALLVPSTALRVAAALAAVVSGAGFALLLSDRQAAEHGRLQTLESTAPSESADLGAALASSFPQERMASSRFDPADEPLVSVVITSWNEAPFIATAIESVRRQTLGAFTCIVVDDASTDDTVDVALEAVGDDPRFRVLRHEQNRGLAAARNTGVSAVRTPYLTFLDGDDFLYPRSLQARLESIMAHANQPWVAGSFCQWAKVSENAELGPAPESRWQKGRQSWFTSLRDTPFIASAAIVRTAVVRSVGGFLDVPTAEDTLFWNRVLREGYVFEPVDEIGVAYRMRRGSLYRGTAKERADFITRALMRNAEPEPDLSDSGPFSFAEPCTAYEWELTRVGRLISALASAVEAGEISGRDEILAALSGSLRPYHIWELPLEEMLVASATLVSRYVPDAELQTRTAGVVNAMHRLLEPMVDELLGEVEQRQRGLAKHAEAPPDIQGAVAIELPTRQLIPPVLLELPDSEVAGNVILLPAASYHVNETGPLGVELQRMGIGSVVMANDRSWPLIASAQAAYRTSVLSVVEAGPWLKHALAVVVLNDWGEEGREYVEAANDLGVPTFAKVEGVQDFNDDDVHWERKAYRRARWVLAQGRNDARALAEKDTIVVSNTRLESIWLGPARPPGPDLAVINLNFTYGVLREARDLWLATAIEACGAAGMPYIISLHPAERDTFSGRYPVSTAPMRHLLTEASALISRFSTVPFEAMARGVPFVYHNPHGERVPTFHNPNGAFDVTSSASQLADSLRETRHWHEGYRDRAHEFFLEQVDVNPERPSAARAAEAIAARLKGV
jgi:glycosyltransferase involved in cell wall biosynthesis